MLSSDRGARGGHCRPRPNGPCGSGRTGGDLLPASVMPQHQRPRPPVFPRSERSRSLSASIHGVGGPRRRAGAELAICDLQSTVSDQVWKILASIVRRQPEPIQHRRDVWSGGARRGRAEDRRTWTAIILVARRRDGKYMTWDVTRLLAWVGTAERASRIVLTYTGARQVKSSRCDAVPT